VEGSVRWGGGGEGLIPTHPVNIPCWRKPEYPEKTHDFRQSVDRLFSHESVARIEPTISEVQLFKALALTTVPQKLLKLLWSFTNFIQYYAFMLF
jgi:hypothetical protein